MGRWTYAPPRELHGKRLEFRARLRTLEAGVTTDEKGRAYSDPKRQADWFRRQIADIEGELSHRTHRSSCIRERL